MEYKQSPFYSGIGRIAEKESQSIEFYSPRTSHNYVMMTCFALEIHHFANENLCLIHSLVGNKSQIFVKVWFIDSVKFWLINGSSNNLRFATWH